MLQPIVFVVAIAFVTVTADQVRCPKGWSFWKNSCYFKGDTEVDFETAESLCEAVDGKLATISSAEENDEIKKLLKDDAATGTWFGLNFVETDFDWEWENLNWRIPLTFLNWAQDEPVTKQGEDRCAALSKRYDWAWESIPCDVSTGMKYVCEKGPLLEVCTRRTCFKLLNERTLHALAEYECEVLGGTLASIRSGEESNAVKGVLNQATFLQDNSFGVPGVWLAGSDNGTEGIWYWDTYGKKENISDGFTDWRTGEPNNSGRWGREENCMVMSPSDWKWNDIECVTRKFILCEISEQNLITLNG